MAEERDASGPRSSANTFTALSRWLFWPITLVVFLMALGSRALKLIDGVEFIVWVVDVYRGMLYPLLDTFFSRYWPAEWPIPAKESVDNFLITLSSTGVAVRLAVRSLGRGAFPRGQRLEMSVALAFFALVGSLVVTLLISLNSDMQRALRWVFPLLAFLALSIRVLSERLRLVVDSSRVVRAVSIAGGSLLLSAVMLIGVRDLNANANVALPVIERFEDAARRTIDDYARDGQSMRPKTSEAVRR